MSRSIASCMLAVIAPLHLAACGPPEYEFEPYSGDPFPTHRTPLEIPEGGGALVSNSYSDSISVLGLAGGETIATAPVGRDPVGLDGPHHIAVAPDGSAVYTALSYPALGFSGPHATHGGSVASGYAQKLDGTDFHIVGQVRVDSNPGDIVLSEDGKRLVVSHFDLLRAIKNPGDIDAARATIAVIDPETIAPTGSPAPVRIPTCVAPHGMTLSRPDGKTAYVACYGEDVLAVVDLEKNEVLSRVPMGGAASGFGDPAYGPYSAVLSPDGARLAIGCTVSNDVRIFDVELGEMLPDATLSTLGSPFFAAWSDDGAQLVVPMQSPDAVAVIDLTTKTETLHRDFSGDECVLPHAVMSTGGMLTLVCEGDHEAPGKVLWLDPATLDTVRSVDVGVYPDTIVPFGGAQ